jgi:two-component system sensor histidine kinase YesM
MNCWYKNLKIKYKLFIILFTEIIIISIFSISALQIAFSFFNEQLYKQAANVLNFSSENIEIKLKEISRLSYRIFSDEDIQECLRSIQKTGNSYEKYLSVVKLKEKLASWAASENYVSSISFIDLNGNEYAAGYFPSRLDETRRLEIVNKTKKVNGNNVWITPSGKDNLIISAREVKNSKDLNLDTLGTLLIKVDSRQLMSRSSGTTKTYGGSIIAVSEGKIIFLSDDINKFDGLDLDFTDKQGYSISNIRGSKFFIAHNTSDYTAWTFLNIIPYEKLFNSINTVRNLTLLIYLIIFLGVIYLGVRFAKGITKPIEKLTDKMKRVEEGDFETEPGNFTSNNEIERLGNDFEIMIGRINTLIRDNYMKQLSVKEAELKALQGQINPHFLYNTLESINWLAMINKQDKISLMVKSLGNLLRNSINNKESIITLENEISIIKSYVTIQKIRYEERLEFIMQIDEGLYQCPVPKLILQPIIENSINYGLEKMMKTCVITVSSILMQDSFEIRISDNGPGMRKDIVEKLQKGEIKPSGSGIGLRNIYERIKLLFGEEYGISVSSELRNGTTVSIRLPYGGE